MKATAYKLMSVAADGLAFVLAALSALGRPWQRLLRLADLRRRTRGDVPVTTQFDGPVRTAGRPNVRLGAHCRLGREVFFETGPAGQIELGAHVRINQGSLLVSYSRLRVGDETLIGEYVSIRDADHGMAVGQPMRLQPHESAPITIGRDVWIARGVVILKGVTIGDGAVIGANSVVTKDVPAMAIAAGVPARVLRQRGAYESAADAAKEATTA